MSDEDDRIVRITAEDRVLVIDTEFMPYHRGYPRNVVIEGEDRTHVVEFVEHG